MRVAVLITGQLRDYKINCLNHIKHLIEPNNADIFVYACTKNTIHTSGQSLSQKYHLTTEYSKKEIIDSITEIYGKCLKRALVNEREKLPEDNFGTLGYFRTRMQNQIDNIGMGFKMAMEYSKENGFEYDVIVRSRPDNSMYPKLVDLKNLEFGENLIYSTIFTPSGHRDLCFFAVSDPKTFEKYCSYKYLEGEDPYRIDNDFKCTEHAWEDYLKSIGVQVKYIIDVCVPFTEFDKNKPVKDFPYRIKEAKLINHLGEWITQKTQMGSY